ncbi:hypothetical protein GCM10023345_03080 [Acinetobacter kookii]
MFLFRENLKQKKKIKPIPHLLADRNPIPARHKEKSMTRTIERSLYVSDELLCAYYIKVLRQNYLT